MEKKKNSKNKTVKMKRRPIQIRDLIKSMRRCAILNEPFKIASTIPHISHHNHFADHISRRNNRSNVVHLNFAVVVVVLWPGPKMNANECTGLDNLHQFRIPKIIRRAFSIAFRPRYKPHTNKRKQTTDLHH